MAVKFVSIIHHEFVRYFMVSLVAFAVDLVLLLLLSNYMHYSVAASASFIAGSFVHYLLSICFVFRRRRFRHKTWRESVIFVFIGGAGLVINAAIIVFIVELFGWHLALAKLVAAAISFLFNYFSRKVILFNHEK